ncbi:MAG: CPXCG motif-containing cysteine-rich protein [Candidatus Nitrohelix vancouverensis]|uniref:CPXCG motif-containing cysteine-rich protein n=1 Tax=Candidatus Nitrohelix vancouverensis TaxID=2705534 RepID=A0A7T0C4Z1_9BACT|nr:MAG: CPXCG motif-containing cysteine-rich protein [Candidatus Nitrohelix vancouverensis]
MTDQVEHFFVCPCCGEEISILIDLSVGNQSYVEDCEVCCRPLEITAQTFGNGEVNVQARPS